MATAETNHANKTESLPPEVRTALAEAIRYSKTGQADPAILQWIHEQAEQIRQEIYRKHGLLNIGVPAIRELRGELPEP